MKSQIKKIFFLILCSSIGAIIGYYISINIDYTVESLIYPSEFVDIYADGKNYDFPKNDLTTKRNIYATYYIFFWEFYRPVTNNLEIRTRPIWSPEGKRIAYLEKIDQDGDESSKETEYSLIIINPFTRKLKTIYATNIPIDTWNWINDEQIIIYSITANSDLLSDKINIPTNEITNQFIGSNYEWSHDKEWYWTNNKQSGITVTDKYQIKNFNFNIKDSKYQDIITASWSPVNDYLALVKENEGDNQMELLIINFNFNQEGKVLLQKNLGIEGCKNMWWDSDSFYSSKFICYNEKKGRLEFKL